MKKVCTRCNRDKELDEFYLDNPGLLETARNYLYSYESTRAAVLDRWKDSQDAS